MADPVGITPGTDTTNGKWRLDVRAYNGTTAGTFVQVKGMSDFSPSVDNTTQDSTNYDSVGWGSDAITLRKWKNEVTVQRKRYSALYDVGQEILRTAADGVSLVEARWYERLSDAGTDGEAYTGFALVSWSPDGGSVEGLSTVKVSLMGQGARTKLTTPVTP